MSNPASPPRRLVLFDSVGCAPPRVMLAPAGAHLPPGVRPVVALAIVSDHRRGGSHAGAAGFTTLTLTAGVAARGPCLGQVQPIVAPNCRTGRRLATECHGFADARTSGALGLAPPSFAAPGTYLGASAVRVVAANRGAGRRLATECHGVADAALYVRTAGALGLGPSFAAPPDHHGVSAFMAVAPNLRTGHRRAIECNGVADAVGHGRTDGGLGLGLSLAAPGNYLGGSTFTFSGSGATRLRGVAVRALDLGEDGEGEEDVSDECRYQDACRQMKSILHLVSLKNRIKTAVHLGIVPSGQKARCMLDAIGHVDPAAPVYHWVIHRCHACLKENLGDKLYEHVIKPTPKEENFEWIVRRGNELYHEITQLMAEIYYAILHTETWRATVRDHAAYDYAPIILSELAGVLAEICTNMDMTCFKRPDPWVIQRMVENHALVLLHLEEALLDFDEILATGEPMDDARTARELRMHYNILFAQDYTPKDYMSGLGSTDTKGILLFLDAQKMMIRQFRGQWN